MLDTLVSIVVEVEQHISQAVKFIKLVHTEVAAQLELAVCKQAIEQTASLTALVVQHISFVEELIAELILWPIQLETF